MPSASTRTRPNIIITGTPGAGKSTHCEQLAANEDLCLEHLNINQIVKERECHEGWDEEGGCWVVDEDKLLDAIEEPLAQGGQIIDWHGCDLFPESAIDLVIVLRCSHTKLYDRLHARGYDQRKIDGNLDVEIMGSLLEEAQEAFDEDIVVEMKSDELEDVESNVERIEMWVKQWISDYATDGRNGVS